MRAASVAKLLVVFVALWLWSAPSHAQVKIGFMATMSGPAGALGQDMYDAFMLGIEHSGGRLGGQQVQVLKEDDQLKPDLATQIVQKLIERERVPIIAGITFSNVLMAVVKPVIEKEVFLIGTNAGPAPVAGKLCSPYFYSTSWQNDNDSEGMGKYARDKGFKKLLLMGPNYQAGKDSLAGFKRFYQGSVIDEVYTQLNQPDYLPEIAQLQSKNPDAVFVFYPGGMGINFLKQYRQAGLMGKVPLFSVSTVDGTTLPALGDVAIGAVTVSHWGSDFDNPQNRRFVEDFEKKHNRIPSKYAAQSYDGALLLDSALRKVKGNVGDKKALQAALKQADFKSVRGAFKFNNNNFPIQDFHLFEVGKDAKGRVNLVTKGKVLTNHSDAYAKECPLK